MSPIKGAVSNALILAFETAPLLYFLSDIKPPRIEKTLFCRKTTKKRSYSVGIPKISFRNPTKTATLFISKNACAKMRLTFACAW